MKAASPFQSATVNDYKRNWIKCRYDRNVHRCLMHSVLFWDRNLVESGFKFCLFQDNSTSNV